MAWRNIWRNKRRTLLTSASVFLAIFLALIMRSLQIGWFDNLSEVVVRSYTGHIQIHKKGYWDDKDINNSMEDNDTLRSRMAGLKNINRTVPRLEYFALASYGQRTKGVLLTGTDATKEDALTHLSGKVVSGAYLKHGGNGVLVAKGLATFLGIHTGDTLVLIGQGYHGISAAGKYPVTGLVHFPAPQLDNQMVYMDLPAAQDFYSAGSRITSLSLLLDNPDGINKTLSELKAKTGPGFEVMRWDEMMVEVMQQLKVKTAGGMIIISILYMIVGFGIFGTVIMMTSERIKEFGVIVSVGMQKSRLASIVVCEMVFIALTGVLAGLAVAIPIMVWFNINPVHLWGTWAEAFINFGIEPLMPLAFKADFIVSNVIAILVIVALTCIFPVRRIMKLKVTEALHK
jgi:putative ABC transport system permease protein